MIYAVIDTNVVVSALLSSLRSESNPSRIIDYIFACEVTPIYNDDIISEYIDVLCRPRFGFDKSLVYQVITYIKKTGLTVERHETDEVFSDKDDIVFYEVTLSHLHRNERTYLVTGNIRHFPEKSFVVTPREFVEIVEKHYRS